MIAHGLPIDVALEPVDIWLGSEPPSWDLLPGHQIDHFLVVVLRYTVCAPVHDLRRIPE